MDSIVMNPNSPLNQKMTEYSNKLSDLYKKIASLSNTTENIRLSDAIREACKRSQQSIFLKEANNNEILEYRQQLISKEPKDINDYLKIGNISLYLYDYYTSSIYYSLSLPQINYFNQGQIYFICVTLMHYGSFQTALSILAPISDHLKEPFNLDAHYRCGIMNLKLLNYKAAIEEFQKIKPANKIPWVCEYDITLLISHAYYLLDDIDTAIRVIESAQDLLPGILQQRCFLYLISNDNAKMDEGLKLLFSHIATGRSHDLLYLQSRLYYKRGHIKEAFSSMNFEINLKNDDPLFWLSMGNIYFLSTQLQEASLCYNRAMMHDKNLLEAWINYGATLELDPSIGDPMKFYQKASDEGNLPIKREALKRKKLIQGLNTSSLIPRVMEPNDKNMFRNAADMIISIYLNERPEQLTSEIINNPEEIVLKEFQSIQPNLKTSDANESSSGSYMEEEEEEDNNESNINSNANLPNNDTSNNI